MKQYLKLFLNYVLWSVLIVWNIPFFIVVILMSGIRRDVTYMLLVGNKFTDIWHALNGVNSHID